MRSNSNPPSAGPPRSPIPHATLYKPYATPKDPSPANLTDAEWTYGSSDGEIFDIIANGVGGGSKMKGVRSTLTVTDMWNIVNFIRSIGPKAP